MKTVTQIGDYSDELGNRIIGTPKSATNSKVVFRGRACTLEIADGVVLQNAVFLFDCDEGRCVIGRASQYKGTIRVGLECSVAIGPRLTVTGNCYISTAERTSVSIGDDCMFASNNEIRCDDAHPIFDMHTGERLNPSRSIQIGNHVWLAAHAVLLSGARVDDGSVVGYRSLLKSHVPPNSIAVGAPAQVIRQGIRWQRSHLTLTPPHFFPGVEARGQRGTPARAHDVGVPRAPMGSAPSAGLRARRVEQLARKLIRNPRRFLADSRFGVLRALAELSMPKP